MPILSDKSKLHFQPLLFDSFKYKSPNSTYQDHYNQRLKKQLSAINRQHNNATQKQKSAALSRGKSTNFVKQNIDLYKKKYDTNVFRKDDEHYFQEYLRQQLANPPQYQPPKDTQIMIVHDENHSKNYQPLRDTQFIGVNDDYTKKYQHVNFNPTVTVNEFPTRPESCTNVAYNIELNVKDNGQKLSSPPPAIVQTISIGNKEDDKVMNLIQENLNLENKVLANAIVTTEVIKEKLAKTTAEAPKATQSQLHWSIYQQEPMPDYIIEAKKRLGQIKQPNVSPADKPPKSPNAVTSPEPNKPNTPKKDEANTPKNTIITKHWSQFDNPSTPDYIKAIRKRLGDDRYRKTDLTKSKSYTNLRSVDSPEATTEKYRIPTLLSINNNIQITSTVPETGNTNPVEEVTQNMIPVSNDLTSQVEEGIEIASKYDETHPPIEKNNVERELNSRTSNDSRMSNKSESQPSLIPFDTWMKKYASDRDKESVIRALKYSDRLSPAQQGQTPSPSPSSKPVYLFNGPQYEFMTKPNNQYNEYVRLQAKNPSPPVTSAYRRGSPTIRKLGMTRGNSYSTNFSLEDEKKYIRDYLWNHNSPAIIKTGYGM